MVWHCSAVSGSAALKKVNGIMKKEECLSSEIPKIISKKIGSWVQLGVPQTHNNVVKVRLKN